MEEQLAYKMNRYIDITHRLKKKLKWSVSNNQIHMMIASMYMVNEKEFDMERFIRLSDYIKDQVGMFSTLKSQARFTTAAMLDIYFEEPEEMFHKYLEVYEGFVDEKFQRGVFTYIAAMVHFLKHKELNSPLVERARSIYKGMRVEHPFLTTNTDYPLSVLLGEVDKEEEALINYVEAFYAHLNEKGFTKGNQLQFLSHILALPSEEPEKVLVDRILQVKSAFVEHGLKGKQAYYPEMGMLALMEDGTEYVAKVQQLSEKLGKEKLFKWYPEMNVKVATNMVVSERTEDTGFIETSLYTAVEAIIQAQQAAMVAVLASSSAVVSSGGDGS
ncbi:MULTISPECIES: DUF4003 family protein [Pontibacillus]|uniref:DUF4003 family protein n=1 Tax=Pontibacillus chungwhensis TaxID=265426 RepID=A0ABY8UX84_9BACI|nr:MULTISPECIES: DUF4003 family protein [Pontibacillus]MCD5323965.1 DUF4003 domain-containing protein [Pontibacillus sp. HN14]WIF97970.1 DUF4003 family protein [Pontibacillus chungwhensis]